MASIVNIAKAITSVYQKYNYVHKVKFMLVLGFAKTNMNGSIVECKWIWRATTSYTSHGTALKKVLKVFRLPLKQ